MICPKCNGLGFIAQPPRGADTPDGFPTCDVLVVDYLRCPALCDHGILVTAAETGGRDSFGIYVCEVEALLTQLKLKRPLAGVRCSG